MSTIKYVNKDNLRVFYKQLKNIIANSGISVKDITSERYMPYLTSPGVQVYTIDLNQASMPPSDNPPNIPNGCGSSSALIIHSCVTEEGGYVCNTYVFFDGNTSYYGSITSNGSDIAFGKWKTAPKQSDILENMKYADYLKLSSSEKTSGKAYFIADDDAISAEQMLEYISIGFNYCGTQILSHMPSSGRDGDFYYIIDDGTGRWYDGSKWVVVR